MKHMSKKSKTFRLQKTQNGAIRIRDMLTEHRFETPNGDGSEWLNLFQNLKMGQEMTVIIYV